MSESWHGEANGARRRRRAYPSGSGQPAGACGGLAWPGAGGVCGTYRGCDAVNDFREVLARPDLDAVVIGTPKPYHVPQSILALQHNLEGLASLVRKITRHALHPAKHLPD